MVHYYKETEEGVQHMCREIEALCNEERKEGKTEGIKEGIKAFVRDNLNEGRSGEQILPKLVGFFNLTYEEAEGFFEEFKALK